MSQVLVVGAGLRRSRLIDKGLEGASVRVIRKRWLTFLHARRHSTPVLVIYDLTGEDTPQTDVLLQLPAAMPEIFTATLEYFATSAIAVRQAESPASLRSAGRPA